MDVARGSRICRVLVGLLTPSGDDQAPRAPVIPVLTQVYALPCAQVELAAGDGDHHRGAKHAGFDMCRHVIRSLVVVLVVRFIFFDHHIKVGFKVLPHGGVGIFVDGKGSGSMLDENLKHTDMDRPDFR